MQKSEKKFPAFQLYDRKANNKPITDWYGEPLEN